MYGLTPRRNLTRPEWQAAYRVARQCRKGEVAHGPVNAAAKQWAKDNITKTGE